MNIMMKKITAVFLCLLIMISLCVPVFADENDGTGAVAEINGTADSAAADTAEEDSGIIDSAALKTMIDAYVKENGLSGNNKVFSIGYCYTATGDTWYYDADQWCYSASLYKVPCCMLLAEKEYNGEITADTQISSQYANGTVDHMEQRSIVNSDNYTGHAVVEYLGGTYSGKCAEQTIKYTDLPQDYFPADFAGYSYYSAKYYTQILKTLYTQSDKFPRIMDYMKQDQNYHYLDLQLNGQYQTAQKYGAFEEKNGNKNYHSAGIIYTPNPVIVTIMTKNITGFEKHIGNVAKMLVDYTIQLDSELASYKANLVIAQQEEQARLAREEQERLAAEAAAQQAAAVQASQSSQNQMPAQTQDTSPSSIFIDNPQQTVTPVSESRIPGDFPAFTLPVIIGLGVLALIFLIVFIIKLRKARLEEDEYDEDDYEEYMRGDLSELAPRQDKKKKSAKEKRRGGYTDDYDEEYDDYDDRYVKRGKRPYKEDRYEEDGYEEDRYEEDRYEDDRYEEENEPENLQMESDYADSDADYYAGDYSENYDDQDDEYRNDYRGGYDDGYGEEEEYDGYSEDKINKKSPARSRKDKPEKGSKVERLKGMLQRKKTAKAVEYEETEEDLYGKSVSSDRRNSRYEDVPEEDFRRYGLGRSDEEDDSYYSDTEDDYGTAEDYDDAGDYSDYSLADYDFADSDSDTDDYLSDYASDDRYSPRH